MAITLPSVLRKRSQTPEAPSPTPDTRVSALVTISVLPGYHTPDATVVVRNEGPGGVDGLSVTLSADADAPQAAPVDARGEGDAGAAATAQPADAPVPEGADDVEGSSASATLELPTDSLLPGEACVVTVPASRPERFVRAAWQSGEDTGTVVAKVR